MSYVGFSSFEEMQKWMLDRTNEANAALADEQLAVSWGDYWARFDSYDTFGVIFGRVFTEDEWVANEMDAGASLEEATYAMEQIRATHREGYMHGDAYSKAFPEAEYGSTHRANLWPIEERVFHAAMAVGWDVTAMPMEHRLNLSIALEEWKRHNLRLIHDQQAVIANERRLLDS